jgi:hypothetical protein
VGEAVRLANLLIEFERRGRGLDTQLAIEQAERRWGFEHNTLYRLRYRGRELEDIKASTLEGLRWAWEVAYEKQRQSEMADLEVARVIEQSRADSLI